MPLRRLLVCAERFSDRAIRRGLFDLKIFGWRSSALLRCVTRADQRRLRGFDSPVLLLFIATNQSCLNAQRSASNAQLELRSKALHCFFPCGSQSRQCGTSEVTLPTVSFARCCGCARIFSDLSPTRAGRAYGDSARPTSFAETSTGPCALGDAGCAIFTAAGGPRTRRDIARSGRARVLRRRAPLGNLPAPSTRGRPIY